MRTRRLMIFIAPLALVGLTSAVAIPSLWAQPKSTFPGTTPIEITVLFPAGSSADVSARLLADGMSKRLGVNVIVVDRPGAGGALGYKFVAGQAPDGHSLVWNSNSISTTYYSGTSSLAYDAFEPVARGLNESPGRAVRRRAGGDEPSGRASRHRRAAAGGAFRLRQNRPGAAPRLAHCRTRSRL